MSKIREKKFEKHCILTNQNEDFEKHKKKKQIKFLETAHAANQKVVYFGTSRTHTQSRNIYITFFFFS